MTAILESSKITLAEKNACLKLNCFNILSLINNMNHEAWARFRFLERYLNDTHLLPFYLNLDQYANFVIIFISIV